MRDLPPSQELRHGEEAAVLVKGFPSHRFFLG